MKFSEKNVVKNIFCLFESVIFLILLKFNAVTILLFNASRRKAISAVALKTIG